MKLWFQIFDQSGKFLKQWTNFGTPWGLFIRGDKLYVVDGTANHCLLIASTKDGRILEKIEGLNNATAVLRGLIYQMLVQQQSLILYVRREYDKTGPKLFEGNNAFIALSNIFTDMLKDASLKRMYLIVDALDECQSQLSQFLNLIVRNASDSSSPVKWLVSSRHRVDIEERLRLEKGQIELDLERQCTGSCLACC